MKVVLQDYQTGLYLGRRRDWTRDQARARLFPNRLRANAYKMWYQLPRSCAVARLDTSAPRGRTVSPQEQNSGFTGATMVQAQIELGLGYAVYIRGEGGDLSWEHGQELRCEAPGVWSWCSSTPWSRILFKLLLNDLVWAKGSPLALEPGSKLVLSPDFEWPEMPMVCQSC